MISEIKCPHCGDVLDSAYVYGDKEGDPVHEFRNCWNCGHEEQLETDLVMCNPRRMILSVEWEVAKDE